MTVDINKLKSLVASDPGTFPTISNIARQLGVSRYTIRCQFALHERTQLRSFLTKVRVEKAKILLASTPEPCKKVCYLVGFSRSDVAARAFRRLTGMTMDEYRRAAHYRSAVTSQLSHIRAIRQSEGEKKKLD